MAKSIGVLEFNSIAKGIETGDLMVKASDVELITANSICPGKYMIMIAGDTGAVKHSMEVGIEHATETAVDYLNIPNVHPDVIAAINAGTAVDMNGAVGVMEFFSIAAGIVAADVAVKSGLIQLIEIRLAFAIGGKSVVTLTGDVSSVKEAVEAGCREAIANGMLIEKVVIPSPSKEVFEKLI